MGRFDMLQSRLNRYYKFLIPKLGNIFVETAGNFNQHFSEATYLKYRTRFLKAT